MIDGLMAVGTYRALCVVGAVFLVVYIPLALGALGPAVVWSGFLEAASVVEHRDSALGDGDVSWDGNNDRPSSACSQGLWRVHPFLGPC